MTLAAQSIASEAIALTPAERAEIAAILIDSLQGPIRSDDEIRVLLKGRADDLASGRDPGLTFEQMFGEPL